METTSSLPSNNENIRWVNISDDAHGVRLRAWDHGRGSFPVRAGLVLRHRDGVQWLAFPLGRGWADGCASPHASAMEARREVEALYIPGCTDSLIYDYSADDIQVIRDALVHVAVLTGQDVMDVNFAHREDVISHLVWYEHLTGQTVDIPAIQQRMHGYGRPDETPSGDDFRTQCIVRGLDR